MSTLILIAIGIALVAIIGLAFGLSDRWFAALLALACLLSGIDAVYRGLTGWAAGFLLSGAMFAGASVHAVYTASRARRQQ
ncbi:hypothetical protein [Streptomyces beihaiensis]|uniref:Uncharacterized protein n=1 Tax=Streptomyces beihaiensis TaxID=2984495 RepID=A0ABT3TU88_9ACTN|nr:hypothetical protein [Streptomyces beihaiensis]MCX3059593.1 hypothetical protein [Streptomyces beihaiensis]